MLRFARVMKVYPESRTADLILIDTGAPLVRVPILGSATSSNTGGFDVPPAEVSGTGYSTGERELVAAVMPASPYGHAIVGFVPPPERQGMLTDPERMLYRHNSDAYWSVDGKGNAEFVHPSGTSIRIGEDDPIDLAGLDVDGGWALSKNLATAPTVTVKVAAAGVPMATLTIGPTGAVTLTTEGPMAITAESVAITGNVTVTGDVTTTGDVRAGTVSLKTHVHGGVTTGGGMSGVPAGV